MLFKIFGDMQHEGRLTMIAGKIYLAGDTYVELADIYEETLHRIDICGLRLMPDKIIICPQETTLFGWRLAGTEWKPTAHTTSALAMAKPPSTVKGLRNFISSFQQFADCVPRYAETLHDLEQLVGGRSSAERIQWTDVNLQAFDSDSSGSFFMQQLWRRLLYRRIGTSAHDSWTLRLYGLCRCSH